MSKVLSAIARFFKAIPEAIRKLNKNMQDKYSPRKLAFLGCVATFLLMIIIVFIPPYIGTSNDGSFDAVLQDTGMQRIDPTETDEYFNYYERLYALNDTGFRPETTPIVQRVLVNIAVLLDTALTGDNVFDVRFLALIYMVLYTLAMYHILYFALSRTTIFTEGVFIVVAGVLILADISYISKFASFYIQPIESICTMVIIGQLLMSIQKENPFIHFAFLMVGLVGLLSVNKYMAFAGFLFVFVLIGLSVLRKEALWKTVCMLFGICLSLFCFATVSTLVDTQTDTEKYHSMTRGVLLQSQQPEETLAEFDIEPRFSVLADTYINQQYPVTLIDEQILNEDFLENYDAKEIAYYYLRHPTSLFRMFDTAVVASYNIRPDFSGNYEKDYGMPPRAKSLFMSLWSSFKVRSAPKTSGFFLAISLAVILLYRRKKQKRIKDKNLETIKVGVWSSLIAIIVCSVAYMLTLVVFTGDSLVIQESYLFAVFTDIIIFFGLAEVINRVDILREKR